MPAKMQHCFNCGEELEVFDHWHGDLECCGKSECQRELRSAMEAERAEAHEQLDRDLGY